MAVSELPGKEVLAEEQGFTIERRYNMTFWNCRRNGDQTAGIYCALHLEAALSRRCHSQSKYVQLLTHILLYQLYYLL